MNRFRLSQVASLTGILSVALQIGVSLVIFMKTDYLPGADDIVTFLSGSGEQSYVWPYLGMLGAFMMMWFAGCLSSAIDIGGGELERLKLITLGGGLATGSVMAVTFAVTSVSLARAGTAAGISPAGATTLYDLQGSLFGQALPVTMAVFVGGASAAILRNKAFPMWFGWLGVLAALGALSPIGYSLALGSMAWIAVASVWLFVRGVPAGTAAATAS